VAVHEALEQAKKVSGKPHLIVCHTVLGKGVSFMENVPGWHGVTPDEAQLKKALDELGLK
jgi:transketolase